jgi:hypothetical protein
MGEFSQGNFVSLTIFHMFRLQCCEFIFNDIVMFLLQAQPKLNPRLTLALKTMKLTLKIYPLLPLSDGKAVI